MERVPSVNTVVFWGDGVIGRDGRPDLNPSGVMLLDFCARHRLSITNNVFKHRVVQKWY